MAADRPRSAGSRSRARPPACARDSPRRTEPSRPHASGTRYRRARASRYSRSKRKMLWPSSTSGSRSRRRREHSPRSWASDIRAPDSTVEKPVESAIAIAMMRSDSRAAFGNSKPGAVVTSMSSAIRRRSPKRHAEERGRPGAQQELVHRIVEEPVGRLGSPRALAGDAQAVIPHPEGLRPGRALREPAVDPGPVERRHLRVALELLEEIGIGQEQERPERLVGGGHRALAPRVDRDVALRGAEGEQAAGRVVPEEEGIVVERQRDRGQLSRPRSRCSSLRAVT